MIQTLFRAYDNVNKKMVYQLIDEDTSTFWNWFDTYRIEDPMQFIGLIDKNGKKGYVGDFYKRHNYLYEIIYDEKTFCYKGLLVARLSDFEIKNITDKINYEERFWFKQESDKLHNIISDDTTEIIGNKYENMFLIKNTSKEINE